MKISPMPRSRTRSSRIASTSHLHGDVERGGRLVGDQEVGLGDQHHGDHHPLAHAAGELVRIGAKTRSGSRICTASSMASALPRASRRAERRRVRAAGLGDLVADASSPGSARYFGSCITIEMRRPRSARIARLARRRGGRCRRRRARRAVTSPGGGIRREDGAAGHATCRSRIRRRCRAARGRAMKETPRTASTAPVASREADAQILDARSQQARRALHRAAFGIEHVAQAVAEQVEAEADDEDGEPGHGRDPPLVEEELAAGGDHRAPFGRRRLGAEAEEAEAGGGQDDARHVEGDADDHRGDAERHDVAQDDAHGRGALQPHRGDVVGAGGRSASRRGRRAHRAARR